jgi:transcriptional regulator with XRE-family HTH domain
MSNTRTALQAALAVELAKLGMTQSELALGAGWRPSTFSGWVRNIGTPPLDFVERIEEQLRIPRGSLPRFTTDTTEKT